MKDNPEMQRHQIAKTCTFLSFMIMITCLAFPLFGGESSARPDLAGIKNPAALLDQQLALLDHLMHMTKRSLDQQTALRQQIVEYSHLQSAYLEHSQDNELLYRLILSGYRVLENIKAHHLEHTFDPEFINQLNLFHKIALQRGIPKP